MLGLIYLILASFVGYRLLKRLLPFIFNLSSEKTLYGKKIELQSWVITIPASILIGTLSMTWFTYLSAYAFKETSNPLLFGNIVSFSVFTLAALIFIIVDIGCFKEAFKGINFGSFVKFLTRNKWTLLYLVFIISFVSYFMIHSFRVDNGVMKIGWSVYSDFGPHLSMIRSFSLGNNFPTEYPHYADGHVRYHFMFQFLAGNLEFLGLRIDWAFNLPSILSMVTFLTLLYGLAAVLTGKQWVGTLAGVFFCFRSSASVFLFIKDEKDFGKIFDRIFKSMDFFKTTRFEDWGLWSFKDYVNQRHFAFSMGIMLLVIIAVYPLFRKMIVQLKRFWKDLKEEKTDSSAKKKIQPSKPVVQASNEEAATAELGAPQNAVYRWFGIFLFSKDAWLPQSYIRAITIGGILGAISFWHGSILISTLLVLCFMAIMSKHRLEYLIMAVMAVGFTVAESTFFMGSGSSAVSPRLAFGFLADSPTLLGVGKYYLLLCGILPILLAVAAIIVPKGGRWLMLSFLVPLIFATTVTLVDDIAINHKYVAVSVILLNIFAANLVYQYISSKGILPKLAAGVLIIALTMTGFANNFALHNMDRHNAQIALENEIKDWVVENTKTTDMFLTDDVVLNQILLSGRRIFNGYGYFAGSAGYDVRAREIIVNAIYGGNDPGVVRNLAKDNNIKFIVVDAAVRGGNNSYVLNEDVIKESFKFVKHFDFDNTDIYVVE